MNWVLFLVLLGFGLMNLLGVGLYHHQYASEVHKLVWYKDLKFWSWTIITLIIGVAYVLARLVEYVIVKKNE